MGERRTRGGSRAIKPPASRLFTNERAFQDQVITDATALGWLVGFTYDSRKSRAGEPDLRMVHKFTGRVIFAELKNNEKAKLTEGRVGGARSQLWLDGQDEWANALKRSPVEFYFWKPSHYESGEILETLQR
jgi:hypothetical protein